MSKKILFMNSTKLAALSVGLLLCIFCTIGMSFTPEDGDGVTTPQDSAYVSGPRRSHYHKDATSGCNSTQEVNHGVLDYGQATAITTGGGTVTISSPSGGGTVTSGNNTTSGSNNGDQVVLKWNCGSTATNSSNTSEAAHKRVIRFVATPDGNHNFKGWSTDNTEANIKVEGSPYDEEMFIKDWDQNNGSHESEGDAQKITYYAIFTEKTSVTVTMVAPTEGGTYTFSSTGGTPNASGTISTSNGSVTTMNAITFTASASSGYKFYGWYTLDGTTENYFSKSATVTKAFDASTTVYAKFVLADQAYFTLKNTELEFYDLKAAINAAESNSSKVIVPTASGTVPAGTYNIPSGITLLIPCDAAYTVKTTKGGYDQTNRTAVSLYRKLTLASGVNITVSGAISIGGKICANNGGSVVAGMSGPFGQLHMNSGSSITLNSGANLYCWGYITGSGSVDATSGSNVYEPFQFDFRGGSHIKDVYKTVFPLNQYFIHNIEVPLTIRYGATETLYTAFSYTPFLSLTTSEATPIYIGSNGLFRLGSGAYITRHYDGTKDRQVYDLYGNATIHSISMEVAGYSLNTTSYVLPITNNMDINIHSGTTTVSYDVSLLADCSITIDNGATVNVNKNLFVYDRAEWVGKGYAMSGDLNIPYYAAGRTFTSTTATGRTSAAMKSAKLKVNGTLNLVSSDGQLYTTTTGGDICSDTDGARVVINNAPNTSATLKESVGTSKTTATVGITPAKLHNADGSYTLTAGASAGTTVYYKNGHWGWKVQWKDYNGTVIKTAYCCTTPSDSWINSNKPSDPIRTYYTFTGWSETSNATTQERIYTATYTPISYTITYTLDGGSVATPNPTSYTIESSAITLNNPTKTGSTFAGWTGTGLSSATQTVTIAAGSYGNRSYTATWTPIKYTIRFIDGDGNVLTNPAAADNKWEYGSSPTYTGATPTKTPLEDVGYSFTGWSSDFATVTADADYTAQFSSSERFYGKRLDIVDWTADSIIINANGLKADNGGTGWTITYNGNNYLKTDRKADRTLRIPRGDISPDGEILIKFSGTDGVESRQKYRVPYLVTTNQNLSALSPTPTTSSVVYVKTGSTLTVSADATISKLYVDPGANVEITSGTLTITDSLVLRTLPWQSAAISGNFTAGHTYYTRIGPDKSTIAGLNGSVTYVAASYYQFAIPFDCNIDDVRLSDGSTPVYETTWALKSYSESKRANDGAEANNWVFVTNSGTDKQIKASKGYEFFSSNTYYREYYFPVTPPTTTTDVAVTRTGNDAVNSGWNMICSPLMSRHYRNPVPEDAVVCWLNEEGEYNQLIPDLFHPAIPFFYQAAASGNVSFAGEQVNPSLAPRRKAAAAEPVRIQWIHLDIKDVNGQGDQTSIYSHPTRYEERYQTGIDVAKQSLTASRATIYTSHSYGEMAFAGVADALVEQGVALTVYSPKEQELTISMRDNEWLNRMAYVWLFDSANGTYTDLLDSEYTFDAAAGTTAGRFYIIGRFFAPQITTDLENAEGEHKGAEKLLIHDKLYIRINGSLYDATGKLVQ